MTRSRRLAIVLALLWILIPSLLLLAQEATSLTTPAQKSAPLPDSEPYWKMRALSAEMGALSDQFLTKQREFRETLQQACTKAGAKPAELQSCTVDLAARRLQWMDSTTPPTPPAPPAKK